MLITLGQGYEGLQAATIDWQSVMAAYIGIPLFLVLWLGYKIKYKTRVVPLAEMTFPHRD